MAKTKVEYPKGKNPVSDAISKLLTKYGGDNWRKAILADLVKEVGDEMTKVVESGSAAYKMFAMRIQRNVKKKKSVLDVLTYLSEEMFKFSDDISND